MHRIHSPCGSLYVVSPHYNPHVRKIRGGWKKEGDAKKGAALINAEEVYRQTLIG